ncbi:MAG: class I SAM-dependent methyltransferase [Planctomycetota bacterium]
MSISLYSSKQTLQSHLTRLPCDLDTATDHYASRFSSPVGRYLLEVQRSATLKMLAKFSEASVLDVGGGHGQNAGLLAEAGYRVMVYGSDASCLGRIRDLVSRGEVEFNVGELHRLPYESKAFEVAISYRVAAHIEEIEGYIREMCRVAERAVVMDFASSRSVNVLAPMLFKQKLQVEKNTRPFNCFSPSYIDRQFAQHGFRRTGRIGQFVWPMAAHRLLNQPWFSRLAEAVPRCLGVHAWLGSPPIVRYEPV